jgi:hypothetical protein
MVKRQIIAGTAEQAPVTIAAVYAVAQAGKDFLPPPEHREPPLMRGDHQVSVVVHRPEPGADEQRRDVRAVLPGDLALNPAGSLVPRTPQGTLPSP